MSEPSRKRFLASGAAAGAFASIAVLRWPGEAAQFSYKLANDQTPSHAMNVQTAEAVKRIAAASNGQLDIRLFPNSALGGDPQMLAQARSGAVEFLQIGSNVLGNIVPASSLLSIPFAFDSVKEYMSAARGPLGEYIAVQTDKNGLRTLEATFYGGTFDVENRVRPIDAPGDLKGLKIRVPPGPLDVATFKAFDASPTVVSLGEVYTSLMTHIVDGIEVPLPTIQNFKFYEQVKYCSLTNHSALTYFTVANTDAWNRLPKKLQEIVQHELGAAAAAEETAFVAQENDIASTLRGEGMVFNRPALEPFRAVVRSSGLYGQWRDRFDPKGWDALEKTTGKLT
ncbi:MAG TPA: TRAP transporter substrate-binding protein [Candidatus Baltobacteraceae bacterium]|nr:TRAP transporter substrate-binding protein [Candidatus Baltobacteraceae bacterium]